MSEQKLILVVDDDQYIAKSITMELEKNNYRVVHAQNGVEAWEKIREERPDLVILDVMMPQKDGYEVCAEIKNDPEYKDLTVILLTGVAEHVTSTGYTHMDGKSNLADDFISKPFEMDNLMEIVKDNL